MEKMNDLLVATKLFCKRNSPTILTYVGAFGVVVTSILAVKATPKAMKRLDQLKKEKGEELTKVEVVKAAAPAYVPAAVVGVTTIACIFGANTANKHQRKALASAYALLSTSYKDYKKKVVDLYGKEADEHVREEIAKDKYEEEKIVDDDDGKKLFYDDFSGRYFRATIERVQHAEYEINRDLTMRDYATVNEFYDYLGIPRIDGGDELGWSTGMNFDFYWQSWIDFGHNKVALDGGIECIILTMFGEPTVGWDDYA